MAAAFFVCLLTAGCEHRISPLGSGKSDYVISYNPYARVDWTSWQRCLAQQHDHLNARFERILAYDEAGYQAVAMLGYGGNPRYAAMPMTSACGLPAASQPDSAMTGNCSHNWSISAFSSRRWRKWAMNTLFLLF